MAMEYFKKHNLDFFMETSAKTGFNAKEVYYFK